APRSGDAQRADRLPRRRVDRAPPRPRHRRGVAELRGLRPDHAQPAWTGRPAARPDRRAREPLLPDREPLPVQREVLPALGVALSRLRGRVRPPEGGAGGHVGRGPAAAAEVAFEETGLGGLMSGEQAPPSRVIVLRRRVLFVYCVLSLALIPWTAYLSSSLQPKHVTTHWDILWPGFDIALLAAAVATAIAVARQSPSIAICASVMGTLLLCDAWFDLWTSNPGSERWWAISEAV